MFSGLIRSRAKKPLLRIDDRLIHGQVVVGWGERLGFRKIMLAHDKSAEDEMLRALYKSLMPPEIEGFVISLEETIKFFREEPPRSKTLIVTGTAADAFTLLKCGLEVEAVVVGGLHHRAGCRELLSYIFLDKERCRDLKKLLRMGIKLFCQDLPDNASLPLTEKLLISE